MRMQCGAYCGSMGNWIRARSTTFRVGEVSAESILSELSEGGYQCAAGAVGGLLPRASHAAHAPLCIDGDVGSGYENVPFLEARLRMGRGVAIGCEVSGNIPYVYSVWRSKWVRQIWV
jgi:hypothetical protein